MEGLGQVEDKIKANTISFNNFGLQDNVNHPSHYTQGKYEVIDIIEDATINLTGIKAVCVANVLKYILRFQYKNGIEDLKKAKWYLDRLINSYKEGE